MASINMVLEVEIGLVWFSLLLRQALGTVVIGPTDYCEHERFSVNCKNNEVVLVQSATYGRMSVGRCINKSYGEIGCSLDVLGVMDDLCSGQTSCSVSVANEALASAKFAAGVCPGLSAYLKASYSCVQVILGSQTRCSQSATPVHKREGYISSQVAIETGYGGPSCPWKISSLGRIVNITLFKFVKTSGDSLLSPTSSLCYEIGKIREGNARMNMMVCGNDPRHKHVYTSHGGEVEVQFTEKAVLQTLGRFILHYKAFQCEVPKLPVNSYTTKDGLHIIIHCNFSDTQWRIKCEESRTWVPDEHTCDTEETWNIEDIFDHEKISVGVLCVVAGGLAVAICLCGFCLYIFLYYCKRCTEKSELRTAVENKDYEEHERGTENLIRFPDNEVKYRENTLKSNAGSSDTSSLDKRTISWPIRDSFRHSSHADTLQQFQDDHESESLSVEDETINSNIPAEEVPISIPSYEKPKKPQK